jgi:hypothetical protein
MLLPLLLLLPCGGWYMTAQLQTSIGTGHTAATGAAATTAMMLLKYNLTW